jgi:hypothetical protein
MVVSSKMPTNKVHPEPIIKKKYILVTPKRNYTYHNLNVLLIYIFKNMLNNIYESFFIEEAIYVNNQHMSSNTIHVGGMDFLMECHHDKEAFKKAALQELNRGVIPKYLYDLVTRSNAKGCLG